MCLRFVRLCFAALVLAMTTQARAENTLSWRPGSWTLIVLPDTQRYAAPEDYPESFGIFKAITRWIADNRQSRNIRFVLHEGDITGGNKPSTWQVASDAMAVLDQAGIPYSLTTGNHDQDRWNPFENSPNRNTLLNDYFPVSRYKAMSTFGGVFEAGKTENNYHLFSAGGKDYITVALEWGPRNEVVAWAKAVLTQHAKRVALIVTHAYLYSDGQRYDWTSQGAKQDYNPHCNSYAFSDPHNGSENVNDGQQLWRKLVSPSVNVRMVFSGHVRCASARQTSVGEHGQRVHEMVYVCHDPPQGYIRLLEFLPDQKTIQVKTYSPYLDQYKTDDTHQYVLTFE